MCVSELITIDLYRQGDVYNRYLLKSRYSNLKLILMLFSRRDMIVKAVYYYQLLIVFSNTDNLYFSPTPFPNHGAIERTETRRTGIQIICITKVGSNKLLIQ